MYNSSTVMKTSAIYVSPDDDGISIRDKMNNCHTARLLLIWQKSNAPFLRVVDIKILLRHAKHLGSQLGAVCFDQDRKSILRELGIVVFDSISDSQLKNWRRARAPFRKPITIHRQPDRLNYPYQRTTQKTPRISQIGSIILALIAFFFVISIFIPSALVVITPKPVKRSIGFTILSSERVRGASINGWLPMRFESDEIQIVSELPSTGMIKIPIGKAVGFVVFQNLTTSSLMIPESTTLVNSSGRSFRLFNDLVIPQGDSRTARIEAMEAGSVYNTAPEDSFIIIGELGESVKVDNQEAILGGTDQEVNAPSSHDFALIKNKTLVLVGEQVEQKLGSSSNDIKIYVPGTLTYLDTGSETYEPGPGEPGKTVKLTMNKAYRAAFLERADILYIANALLAVDNPNAWEILLDSADVGFVGEPAMSEKGVISWSVIVNVDSASKVNEKNIKLALAGKNTGQVNDILLKLVPNAEIRVSVFPSWLNFMPLFPYQIKVKNDGIESNFSN
jgi:hypothetical protein